MKYFYSFLLLWSKFDLMIARSAPEPNKAYIIVLREDVAKWERAIQDLEVQHV